MRKLSPRPVSPRSQFAIIDSITIGHAFVGDERLKRPLLQRESEGSGANDNVVRRTHPCIEAARRQAYRELPYGAEIQKEWGILIYKSHGRWCTSVPIEGTEDEVPFRVGRRNGEIITLDGRYGIAGHHPVVEFAHTHPVDPGRDYINFSGGASGDIWWAERLGIPFSMRYADRVSLFDPNRMKVGRHPVTQEILGHPGRTLFRMGKSKESRSRCD